MPIKPVQIQLGGDSVLVRESRRPLKYDDGYISNDRGFWELVISKGIDDRDRLETVIHEMLHKQFYFLDESVVLAAAKEIVDGLEAIGLI